MNNEPDWDPSGALRRAAEKEARTRINPPWSRDSYWSEEEVMKRFNSIQTAEEFNAELERFEKEKQEYWERNREEIRKKCHAAAQRTPPRPQQTLLSKALLIVGAVLSFIIIVFAVVAVVYVVFSGGVYVGPEDVWWKK